MVTLCPTSPPPPTSVDEFRLRESFEMLPAVERGDILFLSNGDDPIRAGEMVVFKIKDMEIPIVRRVMNVHEK